MLAALALALPLAFGGHAPLCALAPIASLTTSGAFEAARVAAADIEIPKNDGWVTDLAHMLSPEQERELENLMESYRQGTTNEIALLTVPSLNGEPIETLALEVGRAWKIGGKEKNNGALLVVSKSDHKIRIEVGRGLEGNLTDSISGRIIRDVIAPEFKRGDYAAGLKKGIVAIHAAIGGDYGKLPKEKHVSDTGLGGGLAIFILIIIVLIFLRIARGGGRGGRGIFMPNPWMFGGLPGGRSRGGFGGFGGGGGFGGFGGGGGFSGGGASGGW